MATASELKVKVAKIATIVEYLEDEQISQIEKDILLQAVRELYSDILVTDTTKTVVENTIQEEESVNEQQVAVEEPVDENVPETVAAAVVPPVISVAFDDGEFDFSDLLKDKTIEENAEVQEANAPVENIATEDVPAEEAEPEAEIEEPIAEFEPEEFDEPEPEDIEDVDSAEEFEEEDDEDEDLDEVEPETLEEVENEAQDVAPESNFEETVTDNTEINYSFNEEHLQEEQPIVEEDEPQTEETIVNEPVVEETPVVEEEPVVEEVPIVEAEDSVVDEPQVAEMPTIEESVVETPQNDEEKTFEQEKPEPTHITLGEQLGQSRQSSLNDKFASNKPLEGSIGLKPISDIKSAIPLGERFRFTRMLFSGNGPAFDSTVATLNGMSNMEAADNYIRTNFSWDMDSPVVADFMNIVRRRYL
ncbi:MAG: hypothetical protein IK025_00730 [Bacteroidales bacterium]|nr:hypothetical protein [Bacteroidales bacterium]